VDISLSFKIIVIGAGPAGLMAAEVLAKAGACVCVYDRMSGVGRKLLMAGRGGLNLTHSEDVSAFVAHYGMAEAWVGPAVQAFTPTDLRAWCEALGQETFVGSSGRVFPRAMKASPLLRAWLKRLQELGVTFSLRRRWQGWDDQNRLLFSTDEGQVETVEVDAVLLAMGGASWPHLGSDGGWHEILARNDVPLAPLRPANCGFIVPWSDHFREKFAGQPLKSVNFSFDGTTLQGEATITAQGIQGGGIYTLSSRLREAIDREGSATLTLDLRPGVHPSDLEERLQRPRGSQSLSTYLRKAGGLSPIAIGLVHEIARGDSALLNSPEGLAGLIKALPLKLTATTGIERAISTAGGVKREAFDDHFMLMNKPGVFVAGEMMDWEAPTGGYLLQGCFSTAVMAAQGILKYLSKR